MGLFSWECKSKLCDHSIKSPYELPIGWEYMNEAVVLRPSGKHIIGEYDGYGRINGIEVNCESDEPEMWHKRCWEMAGKPPYSGPSEYAEDQGFFYEGDQGEIE